MFRFLMIFWLQLAGYSGLQWAERFQANSGPMEVCSGQNIRRFWKYTLDQGEFFKGIEGTCKAAELLVLDVDDNFVPMSEFSGRLPHLQDGGKELSGATISEFYNCNVSVNTVDTTGTETPYNKTAWVKVVDTPKDRQLEVRQEREAARSNDTSDRQWHVHLTCGHFVDLDHPAVDVEWKTPNGETLSSSYFLNGNFHLLLSNPVKGGNYTCSLPSLSPATRCLPPGSALLNAVTLYVDEMSARLSIIEARQIQMQNDTQNENKPQHDVIAELTNKTETLSLGLDSATLRVARLQDELDSVKNESDRQNHYIYSLQNTTETLKARLATATLRVSFHARLTSSFSGNGTLTPFTVIANEGNAFNGTTGIFTAPVNGTYFFAASAGTESGDQWVVMHLKKDGVDVSRAYTGQSSGYHTMGSVQATLYLTAGQIVWLYSDLSHSFYYYPSTSFTGFLIRADD